MSDVVARLRVAAFLTPAVFEKQLTVLVENSLQETGGPANLSRGADWFFSADYNIGGHQQQAVLTAQIRKICCQQIKNKVNELPAWQQWWTFLTASYQRYPEQLDSEIERQIVQLLPEIEKFEKKLAHVKVGPQVERAEKILTFLAKNATQKETLTFLTTSLREKRGTDYQQSLYQKTLAAKVCIAGRLAVAANTLPATGKAYVL